MLKACTTYLRHSIITYHSSWLECKVEKQATIDAKNYVTSQSYVNAKIITNWKRRTDRLAEREKQ